VDLDHPTRELMINPNPTTGDAVQLVISGVTGQEVEIVILNMNGEQMLRSRYEVTSAKQTSVELALSNALPVGFYIAKVKTFEGVMITKFIVHK
jgi:hypothetical protein